MDDAVKHLNLVTIASALQLTGRSDWSLIITDSATPIRVRTSRNVLLLGREWLDLATPDVAVNEVCNALNTAVDHPGYEATCPMCSRVFTRTKPAAAEHHCGVCGPVFGALRFE